MHALQNLKLDDPGPISVDQAQEVLEITIKKTKSLGISSYDRQCSASAFAVMHGKRPSSARKLYLQIAQLVVNSKQDALPEVLRIFSGLKKSPKSLELKELLDTPANQLQPLKLLALQSLCFSSPIPKIPVESIFLVAQSLREPGQLAAYKFLKRIPNNELSRDHLHVIKLLSQDLGLQNDGKNSEKLTGSWQSLAKDEKWAAIEPLVPSMAEKEAVQLLKHMTGLKADSKTDFEGVFTIYKQLVRVLTKDSLLLPISNALFNLGQRCRPKPLYLQMWALAIELEIKRGAFPSLYEKTARFAQAIAESDDALLPQLAAAVTHLCQADPFFKGNLLKPLGAQWSKLVAALVLVVKAHGIDAFDSLELLLMISPDYADEIMKRLHHKGLKADKEKICQYACLYYSSTKKAPAGLSELIPASGLTRTRGLAVLAQTSELEESYRLSKEVLAEGSTGEFASFLAHQGFFKLYLESTNDALFKSIVDPTSTDSGDDPDKIENLIAICEQAIHLQDIVGGLQKYRNVLESVQKELSRSPDSTHMLDLHMDICMRLSQLFVHIGNARDASLYLKDSIDKAAKSNAPLRQRVYIDAWNELGATTGQDPLQCDLPGTDDLLHECLLRYTPLSSSNTNYKESQAIYSQVIEDLEKDPLYAMVVDSARSMPRQCGGSDKKQGVAVEFLKNAVANLSVSLSSSTSWLDRDKHRRLYYDAASLLTSTTNADLPKDLYQAFEKQKHSYIIESRQTASASASTSAASNDALEGIIVVSINVGSNGELHFSRKVPGRRELLVALPPARVKLLFDEEYLSVDAAKTEIKALIDAFLDHAREHNQELDSADKTDEKAERERRRDWWKKGLALELELVDVLRRMESHWLGGFKGLLSVYDRSDTISLLQKRLETTFATFVPRTAHEKLTVQLQPEVVELFAALGHPDLERPEPRDYEDLVYFVLDTLQFQGSRVAYDEIELEDILADVQLAVKRYHQSQTDEAGETNETRNEKRHHLVLIPDSKCQSLPWESLPCLKRVPTSRALSLDLLHEAAAFAGPSSENVFYLLNPGNDLKRTQEQFEPEFRLRGWKGVSGHMPPEQQVLERLQSSSFYVYIGHGAGQSHLRQPAVRALPKCCPVMLMGCSSTRLQDASSFDGFGPLTDYTMAGSPLVVGNLWDVVDKDSNRFTKELLSRFFDDGEDICSAVCESRRACVLRYLTGGAPVVYGLPWRLAST